MFAGGPEPLFVPPTCKHFLNNFPFSLFVRERWWGFFRQCFSGCPRSKET